MHCLCYDATTEDMLDATEMLADNTDFDSLRIQVGIQIALLGEPFPAELALARPGMCGGSKSALALGNSRVMSGGAPELKMLRFNVPLDKMPLCCITAEVCPRASLGDAIDASKFCLVIWTVYNLCVVFPFILVACYSGSMLSHRDRKAGRV